MTKELELARLRDFKESNPWSGTYDQKKEKFKDLMTSFCEIHKVESPKLIVPRSWKHKRHGDCWFKQQKIRMRNFSVLTLLHEFKHWSDFCQGMPFETDQDLLEREWEAKYYSTSRFYSVWPERVQGLQELIDDVQDSDLSKFKTSSVSDRYKYDPHLVAIVNVVRGKI